jgi:hypothetical protein
LQGIEEEEDVKVSRQRLRSKANRMLDDSPEY